MIAENLAVYGLAVALAAVAGAIFPRMRFVAPVAYCAFALLIACSLASYAQLSLIDTSPFGGDETMTTNALWNMTEGSWAYSDLFQQNLYSIHSFFALPLYLPFFAFLYHPHWFNIVHLAFGFSAVFAVYLLGRDVTGSRECGVGMSLVFCLLPTTSGFMLVECQPSIPGVVFFFLYFVFRHRKRRLPALLCACVASFGYEPFIAAVILEGIAETLSPRIDRRFGAGLVAIGAFVLSLWAINLLGDQPVSGTRHFKALGGGPEGVLRMLVENPRGLAELILLPAKAGFVFHLLFPLLMLPLMEARYLVAGLPEFSLCILSDRGDDMHRIYSFYTHVATISMVVGSVYAVARVARRLGWPAARVAFVLFAHIATCHFTYRHNMIPRFLDRMSQGYSWSIAGMPALSPESLVPEGRSVAVTRPTDAWRFPHRRVILLDHYLTPKAARMWDSGELQPEFLIAPRGSEGAVLLSKGIAAGWLPVGEFDGLIVLRRWGPAGPG